MPRVHRPRDWLPEIIPSRNELRAFALPANNGLPSQLQKYFQTDYLKEDDSRRQLLEKKFGRIYFKRSRWKSLQDTQISAALFPNRKIDWERSQPVWKPLDPKYNSTAKMNMERLENLWRMSGSHGVSWKHIDTIFVWYCQMFQHCQEEFTGVEASLREDALAIAKQIVHRNRTTELRDIIEKNKISRDSLILNPRSHIRRTAERSFPCCLVVKSSLSGGVNKHGLSSGMRIFYDWKRTFFSPFRKGSLTKILKLEATQLILQRETKERCLDIPDYRHPSHP